MQEASAAKSQRQIAGTAKRRFFPRFFDLRARNLPAVLLACVLVLAACSGSSQSGNGANNGGGAPGAGGGAASVGGGGGASGVAGGGPMTKHDWAKLLITGPVIEVRCDIAPGKVRLQYKEWPGPCTEVASTESCSKVECHFPANTPALTPAEPVTMRSGSITLTLPADGKTYSVAADGTCGDTVEIQVGEEKVVVPAGAPLTKCTYGSGAPGGVRYEAAPVSSAATFGVQMLVSIEGGELRGICLADPGVSNFSILPDAPESLVGLTSDLACFAAELRPLTIGGRQAAVSSFRFRSSF